jgi:hypothetical protein
MYFIHAAAKFLIAGLPRLSTPKKLKEFTAWVFSHLRTLQRHQSRLPQI